MSEDALDRKAVERFAGNVTHGLLKAVPEADLFAMLSDAEYAGLKRSILDARKINMPIHIAEDGAIVDGRNRAKALHDLGLSRMDAPRWPGTTRRFVPRLASPSISWSWQRPTSPRRCCGHNILAVI